MNARLAKRPWLRKLAGTLRLAPRSQIDIPWPRNVSYVNLRSPLPYDENAFDAVYASHTLEHLYRDEALRLLREGRRVVRPGGHVRMLVPDLAGIVQEYLGQIRMPDALHDDDPARRMCRRLLMRGEQRGGRGLAYSLYLSRTDFHSHKWMYDGPSLVKLFNEAGFADARVMGFRESAIPHLDKVEMPTRSLGGIGVAVEAVK
ncbi:MAG: methyltransferase domain-containing protein [Tepidisphaeraceae bacterium]